LHASLALGYNTIEHAWLGLKSSDQLWANIDPAFHESLNKETVPTSEAWRNQFVLKKFYLIGCMLPDLFTSYEMSASRDLIEALHPYSDLLTAPLKIYDHTASMVATDLNWLDPQPNDNFPALWKMVQYAKSQNWSPYEKALIYGACAHVAMDLMAGCYQQPSLYGSDFVADPPSAESSGNILADILADMEMQGNIFEPTYVSAVNSPTWERLMYYLYGWPTKWSDNDYSIGKRGTTTILWE
jgi:hypothetical protein